MILNCLDSLEVSRQTNNEALGQPLEVSEAVVVEREREGRKKKTRRVSSRGKSC